MAVSTLNPMQAYAAGALLALALHQGQVRQTRPVGFDDPNAASRDCGRSTAGTSSSESEIDNPDQWIHESRRLLRPVFRFLDIKPNTWPGLEQTAVSSVPTQHIRAHLRIVFEGDSESSPEKNELELALAKGVDAMSMSLEAASPGGASKKKHHNFDMEDNERTPLVTSSDRSLDAIPAGPYATLEKRNSKMPPGVEGLYLQLYNPCTGGPAIVEDFHFLNQRRMALLYQLLSACVADTPEDNKISSQIRKGYDARHRAALRLLATWLDVKWIKVEAMEIMVACSAMAAAKEQAQLQENESSSTGKSSKWKNVGIIGVAALAGGAVLGISGGLAAPGIAAGLSVLAPALGKLVPVIGGFAIMASAKGSVACSVAVAASFGAAGAGLTGSKMARRIGDIEEFEFKQIGENHNQGRLAVGIFVSGFVFEEEDYLRPWIGQQENLERYIIQWESKNLIALSTAIQDWLTSKLATELMKHGAMRTVLSSLVHALAWPTTLITAADLIDSKWAVAIDRSDKAGKLLADVLVKGLQGNRPITLIGFSLGARVVFKCLQALAVSGDEGIVERVVLLGAPISVNNEQWDVARKVVAGRFINVYSTNDWILGIAFRASLLTKGLAGIQPVEIPGLENIDATDFIDGHSSYLWSASRVLEQLELDSYYPVFAHVPVKPCDEQHIKTEGWTETTSTQDF